MSTPPDRVWLQRVCTSVQVAQDLRVRGAAPLTGELRGYETLHDVPPEVIEDTRVVLAAVERLVSTDRPTWAAAIREELAYLGPR